MIDISFVIPAKDEQHNLPELIRSIRKFASCLFATEIIVVENNSSDRTYEVARELADVAISSISKTIALIRNEGAAVAQGEILIFLDADVRLTPSWSESIADVIRQLKTEPNNLYGSHCSVSDDADNIYEKYWFSSFEERPGSPIGSAHMILAADLFRSVGGFDARLVTGEDYDLCQRIVKNGGKVVKVKRLKVVHDGFPTSAASFFLREQWHGVGDVQTARAAFASKAFLASTLFTLFLMIAVIVVLFGYIIVGYAIIILAYLLALSASYAKFKNKGMKVVFINSCIFPLYFLARCASLFHKEARGK